MSEAPAAASLPNLALLIKLLRMTTSSNDAEALIAMRKANEQLAKVGGDWEKLLMGRVNIIADPFASIPSPPRTAPPPMPTPQPVRTPGSIPPTRPWSPPPPPPPPPPPLPASRPNLYPGFCYCCGSDVEVGKAFIFRHPATGNWEPVCVPCNRKAGPLPNRRARKRHTSSSLMP